MKSKLPAVVVFIFILIVIFFLFPRGCSEATPATMNDAPQSANMKGAVWI